MKRILFPGNMRQPRETYCGVTLQILVAQTDQINSGVMGPGLAIRVFSEDQRDGAGGYENKCID